MSAIYWGTSVLGSVIVFYGWWKANLQVNVKLGWWLALIALGVALLIYGVNGLVDVAKM